MTHRILLAGALCLLGTTAMFIGAPKRFVRNYHPLEIQAMVAEDPNHWSGRMGTHVQVTGFVTYMAKEDDGDMHIRICDSANIEGMDRAHCIVAECIPALPCMRARVGQHVRVRGISRFDAEGWNPKTKSGSHGWWEVHPVESLIEFAESGT